LEDLEADQAELEENTINAFNRVLWSDMIIRIADKNPEFTSFPDDGEWSSSSQQNSELLCDQFTVGCLFTTPMFDGSRGVFDELVGSGNLSVFENRTLASQVVRYYSLSNSRKDTDFNLIRPTVLTLMHELRSQGVSRTGRDADYSLDDIAELIRADAELRATLFNMADAGIYQVVVNHEHEQWISEIVDLLKLN